MIHLPIQSIKQILTTNPLVERAEPDIAETLYQEFSHVGVVTVWAFFGGAALFFLAPVLLLVLILVPMIVAARTALYMSREAATGNLEMIRLTPLSSRDVIHGYLIMALYRVRVFVWLALVCLSGLLPMLFVIGGLATLDFTPASGIGTEILATELSLAVIGIGLLVIEPPMILTAGLIGITLSVKWAHPSEVAIIAPLLVLVIFALMALPVAIAIQGMMTGFHAWFLVLLIYPIPYVLNRVLMRSGQHWI